MMWYVGRRLCGSNSTARVRALLVGEPVVLEPSVMRRHDGERLSREQLVEDRHRERTTLLRIGAGPELIEQHERAIVGVIENSGDIAHVSRRRSRGSARYSARPRCRRTHRRSTGSSLPGSAGISRPNWFMSASRPTVFSETVLPPVLGPVTMSTRLPLGISTLIGTALSPSSGWRAPRRRSLRSR